MHVRVIKQLALNVFRVSVDGVEMTVIPQRGETPEAAVKALFT